LPISGDVYKQIGRSAAGAVSIVAAYDRTSDRIVGLTASSFVTLSFDPPLVMFAIQHNTGSYVSMVSSKSFGVSLLRDTQAAVATLFATTGPEKTGKTTFEPGTTLHVPLIPGALAHVECMTNQIFISGDHAIVVGLVEEARTFDGLPLLYFARQYGTFCPLEGSDTVSGDC
jgi:flavin reductase (DIM6/NTAB) family NADH-FMN oxidoreductase RutF